ncbi:hypothetical protein Kisp01_61450 [Kineosporia sp. NBRC 101677]|nr:hypothetical protein Kisp01_61450 [Kineosporia sp. NBRC 101677]
MVTRAGVREASASAMLAQCFAAACGHFMSAKSMAWASQERLFKSVDKDPPPPRTRIVYHKYSQGEWMPNL